MRRPTKDAPSSTGKLFREAREKSDHHLQLLISDSSERFTDKTSPSGGATIKIMKTNKINTEHRYQYVDEGILDAFGDKMGSVDEYVDEMEMLMDEIRSYKKALHDAISRPMGVVPESAENLYDQNYYNK